MVVTVMWMQSWTVVIISVAVLSIIVAVLLCCVCWESKTNSLRHFYILDKNGLQKVASSVISSNSSSKAADSEKGIGLFRHLSSGSFKANLSFLNNNGSTSKMLSTERRKFTSRSDLTQSMEIAESFDKAVLRLEENEHHLPLDCAGNNLEEDVQSCVSNDSKHTFYSTYHIARTVSVAETIRSALSHSDLNSCANE